MWFQHLAWNHVCMISYLHCLVFKEHCFLTSFVKSLSFCKLSVWVSFYIIPHSVPFVKNFLKYFLLLLSKQPRQAFSSKALLCCISATTVYILQQICTSVNTFIKFFSYFFFPVICKTNFNPFYPNTGINLFQNQLLNLVTLNVILYMFIHT